MPQVDWYITGSMGNMPKKDDPEGRYIRGEVKEDGKKISLLNYKQEGSTSWVMCEIILDGWTPQGIADAIARALTEARDIGFEQGRAHIRKALGV